MKITHDTLSDFANHLKDNGKKDSTVASYCRDTKNFLNFLNKHSIPFSQVDQNLIDSYQSALSHELAEKENSIRRAIISLRQFFRFLTLKEIITDSPFEDTPIPFREELMPRILSDEDIAALLKSASASPHPLKAARDRALLSVLCFEGIKVTELTNLKWSHFLMDQEKAYLKILGERSRTLSLSLESKKLLVLYKELYEKDPHARSQTNPQQQLFIAFKGKDTLTLTPQITRHGLKFLIYELGEASNLGKINTEMLRHFAMRHLLSLGKSPEEVMDHFGLRRIGNIAKHLRTRPAKI
jgi:integrase/recombinase XerD